jgi:hypothetical protein
MIVKFLINPSNQQIAAKLEEYTDGKKLTILDERIMRILNTCGVNVPRDLNADRSCHIFLDNPDQNLLAEAFEQHFYPHGLMQKGFHWVNEQDYNREESNFNRSQNIVDAIIEKHVIYQA